MRGSPLFRLALTALALVLAGIPVWTITRPSAPPPLAPVVAPTGASREVTLTLTASAPAVLSATCLGKSLLSTTTATLTASARVVIDASNPEDLVVAAAWEKSAAPQALRVEIIDAHGTSLDQTFWGTQSVEESVTP